MSGFLGSLFTMKFVIELPQSLEAAMVIVNAGHGAKIPDLRFIAASGRDNSGWVGAPFDVCRL